MPPNFDLARCVRTIADADLVDAVVGETFAALAVARGEGQAKGQDWRAAVEHAARSLERIQAEAPDSCQTVEQVCGCPRHHAADDAATVEDPSQRASAQDTADTEGRLARPVAWHPSAEDAAVVEDPQRASAQDTADTEGRLARPVAWRAAAENGLALLAAADEASPQG